MSSLEQAVSCFDVATPLGMIKISLSPLGVRRLSLPGTFPACGGDGDVEEGEVRSHSAPDSGPGVLAVRWLRAYFSEETGPGGAPTRLRLVSAGEGGHPRTLFTWPEGGEKEEGAVEEPGEVLTLDVSGATEFQVQVWEALIKIGAGTTSTYGEIARKIGRPRAFRAIGNACGANPLAIFIPCHRVVAAHGGLGGFMGGIGTKIRLLQLEGVLGDGAGRVESWAGQIPDKQGELFHGR